MVNKVHLSYAGARTDQAAKDIKEILKKIETTSKRSVATTKLVEHAVELEELKLDVRE
jgi:hypothetical protein